MATASVIALSSARAQDTATDGTTVLKKITIDGSDSADGPVEGYVAKASRVGTKTATPIKKTPQSISVVPRQQMEDQAVTSVAEALRYSAGAFTEYRGESNLHDELFLRGYYYIPRFLDGLAYGTGSLGQIDPYLLERVELLRGPSSVLYGAANPGGIVNLVSKKPTDEPLHEVELSVGTNQRLSAGFDFSDKLPNSDTLSYRLTGIGYRTDLQENFMKKERFAIAPSLTWQPDDQTKLTILSLYQHEPEAGFRNFREKLGSLTPTAYGYIPRDFLVSDPDYDISTRTQASIGYQFEHEFDEVFTVRQNVRYNVIETDYRTLTWGSLAADGKTISRTASGGSEDLRQFVVDNQLQAEFGTGALDHTLLVGLDYKAQKRDYQWGFNWTDVPSIDWTNPVYGNLGTIELTPTDDSDTKTRQLGIYMQDQIEIGNLNLLFGGRHDWASTDITDNLNGDDKSFDDSAFSWRTGAVYNFDNGISPYVSYSTSFEPVIESAPAGEPAFDPTTAQQYEAGIRYAPDGSGYQIIASVYDIRQQNVLFYDYTTSAYTQTGEIHNRGFELEAHAEINENLSLVASYSHIRSEVTESVDSSVIGKMPARIPIDQASLWAKYQFTSGTFEGLGLGAGVRFIGKSYGDSSNSFTVPNVTLLDASLSYDLGAIKADYKGTKLQVNATNLTDEDYVASCASAYACFAGTGRTVTASLKYSW